MASPPPYCASVLDPIPTCLSYPDRLESVSVRSAARIGVHIIVTVHKSDNPDEPVSARLVDISTTGGCLVTNTKLGKLNDSISIEAKFSIGPIEPYVTLPAIIRRIEEAPDPDDQEEMIVHYGIQFGGLDEKDRLALHGLVYQNMIGDVSSA